MSISKSAGIKTALAASVLGAVIGIALWQRAPNVAEVGGYPPDFTLPALDAGSADGAPIHLSEHRGHVVLVNFWATWCPPCIEETPSLEALSNNMRKLGVEVIGVSVDQDPAAVKKFIDEHNLSFPIVLDPDQRVASRYGTSKFPETYILDRDGRVAEKIIGATNWADPQMISFVKNLASPTKASD